VSAAECHQTTFGLRITEHSDVGAQGFAEGAATRMGVRGERGSGSLGGGQKLFALITVTGLGGKLAVHVGLLLVL
jgi:hypothetical protein